MKLLKKIRYETYDNSMDHEIHRPFFGEPQLKSVPAANPFYALIMHRGRSNQPIISIKYSPSTWKKIQSSLGKGKAVFFGSPINQDGGEDSYLYLFKGNAYESQIHLSVEDVALIIDQDTNSKKESLEKQLERIKAKVEAEGVTRSPISEDVQILVWNRDGGKCVKCESNTNLEFDHIIPVSKGGSNTARNIQLLCEKCNRQKGASVGG